MSDDELREIEASLGAATPGPWVWREAYEGAGYHELAHPVPGEKHPNGDDLFWYVHSDGSAGGEYGADIDVNGPDTDLIANAPADLRRLLDEVRQLRAVLGDKCNDDDRMHAARELGRREGVKEGRVGMRAEAIDLANALRDRLSDHWGSRELIIGLRDQVAALPDTPPPAEGGAS